MRKILFKYSFLIISLLISIDVIADGPGLPIADPHGCCEEIYGEDFGDLDPNDTQNPLYIAYNNCLADEAVSPGSSCNPVVPIDNSRYIYISIVAAAALASFVIARAVERKNKKTPM